MFRLLAEADGAVSQAMSSDIVTTLTIIIFWLGGYIAAPLLFIATLGVFRNLAGMSTSRFKQATGKMREPGKRERERYKGFRSADREAGRNTRAARNASIRGAGSRFTQQGRAARRAAEQSFTQQTSDKILQDENYTWKNDDGLNRVVAETSSAGDMESYITSAISDPNHVLHDDMKSKYADANGNPNSALIRQDVARAEQLRGKYGTEALRQAAYVQAHAGGTSFQNADEAWDLAGEIAGGDDHALASLVAKGRSASMGAGRVDLGGGSFGTTFRKAKVTDKSSPDYMSKEDYYKDVVASQGPGILAHSSMKDKAVKQIAPVMLDQLRSAASTGDNRAFAQELASTAGLLDAMGQSNKKNAKVLADNLMNEKISAFGGQDSVRELIETYRSDPDFGQMRREYESQYSRQAQLQSQLQGQQQGQPGQPPGQPPGGPQLKPPGGP